MTVSNSFIEYIAKWGIPGSFIGFFHSSNLFFKSVLHLILQFGFGSCSRRYKETVIFEHMVPMFLWTISQVFYPFCGHISMPLVEISVYIPFGQITWQDLCFVLSVFPGWKQIALRRFNSDKFTEFCIILIVITRIEVGQFFSSYHPYSSIILVADTALLAMQQSQLYVSHLNWSRLLSSQPDNLDHSNIWLSD